MPDLVVLFEGPGSLLLSHDPLHADARDLTVYVDELLGLAENLQHERCEPAEVVQQHDTDTPSKYTLSVTNVTRVRDVN